MKKFSISLFILFVALLLPFSAACDEVFLKNGNQLSGSIIKMADNSLTLETPYAGEVQIKWDEVACVSIDQSVILVFTDDESLSGTVTCDDDNFLHIQSEQLGEIQAISIKQIKYINPPKPITHKGSLLGGGSRTDGNTDTFNFNVAGWYEARSKKHRFSAAADHITGETDDVVTARKTTGSLKYDLFYTPKLYNYAQTFFERDDILEINLRTTLGLGLGYQFWDEPDLRLFAETGVSYVNTDYDVSEDQDYTALRCSAGLDWNFFKDRVQLFHFQELYYNLETSDSYFFRTKQGFHLPIVSSLAFNIEVDYDYDSQPVQGGQHSTTTYILGLIYNFKF